MDSSPPQSEEAIPVLRRAMSRLAVGTRPCEHVVGGRTWRATTSKLSAPQPLPGALGRHARSIPADVAGVGVPTGFFGPAWMRARRSTHADMAVPFRPAAADGSGANPSRADPPGDSSLTTGGPRPRRGIGRLVSRVLDDAPSIGRSPDRSAPAVGAGGRDGATSPPAADHVRASSGARVLGIPDVTIPVPVERPERRRALRRWMVNAFEVGRHAAALPPPAADRPPLAGGRRPGVANSAPTAASGSDGVVRRRYAGGIVAAAASGPVTIGADLESASQSRAPAVAEPVALGRRAIVGVVRRFADLGRAQDGRVGGLDPRRDVGDAGIAPASPTAMRPDVRRRVAVMHAIEPERQRAGRGGSGPGSRIQRVERAIVGAPRVHGSVPGPGGRTSGRTSLTGGEGAPDRSTPGPQPGHPQLERAASMPDVAGSVWSTGAAAATVRGHRRAPLARSAGADLVRRAAVALRRAVHRAPTPEHPSGAAATGGASTSPASTPIGASSARPHMSVPHQFPVHDGSRHALGRAAAAAGPARSGTVHPAAHAGGLPAASTAPEPRTPTIRRSSTGLPTGASPAAGRAGSASHRWAPTASSAVGHPAIDPLGTADQGRPHRRAVEPGRGPTSAATIAGAGRALHLASAVVRRWARGSAGGADAESRPSSPSGATATVRRRTADRRGRHTSLGPADAGDAAPLRAAASPDTQEPATRRPVLGVGRISADDAVAVRPTSLARTRPGPARASLVGAARHRHRHATGIRHAPALRRSGGAGPGRRGVIPAARGSRGLARATTDTGAGAPPGGATGPIDRSVGVDRPDVVTRRARTAATAVAPARVVHRSGDTTPRTAAPPGAAGAAAAPEFREVAHRDTPVGPVDRSRARVRPAVIADTRQHRERPTTRPEPASSTRRSMSHDRPAIRSGRTPGTDAGATLQRRPGRGADRAVAQDPRPARMRMRRPSSVVQRTADPGLDGPGAPARSELDIDQIVRELEDRVLAEIDRRGGRFAGSF